MSPSASQAGAAGATTNASFSRIVGCMLRPGARKRTARPFFRQSVMRDSSMNRKKESYE